MLHGPSLFCGFCFGEKIPEGEVVHNVLDLLHVVLDAITSTPQRVVLQVQDLEARVYVFDELADLQRPLIVAQGDRVDGQSCKLFNKRYEGLEILLNGDVEGVLVLEINRNCAVSLALAMKDVVKVPLMIFPTSSMVKSLPGSGVTPNVPIPPSHPQKSTVNTTFWTSLVHRPLYLYRVSRPPRPC